MRAARSAAVRRGALGLVVVTGAALVSGAPAGTAAVAPGDTTLVTRSNAGTLPESDAVGTAISGDGRHVVFASRGSYTDLDNDFSVNVFARDLGTGTTTQISVADDDGEPVPPDGDSSQPALSADGRYVAFVTTATTLAAVEGDDHAPDVVVADRDADGNGTLDDTAPEFHRISDSHLYAGSPRAPRLSADGGRVLWTDEEVVGEFGRAWVVRYRDLDSGAPASPIVGVSADPDPADLAYPVGAYDGALSADGTHAAMAVDFVEYSDVGLRAAPLLRMGGAQVAPLPDYTGIVLVRLLPGEEADEVSRVDYDEDGSFLGAGRGVGVRFPALSGDGSVVAFEAEAYDTAPDGGWRPAFDQPNVYVHLRGVERSRIASVNSAGEPRNGARPALSADGRYLAFVTDSPGMHDGVDWEPSAGSCLHESDASSVPPPGDERNRRTHCQVVVRDLVLDGARADRLPGVLASPGRNPFCAGALPTGESCAGDADSGLSRSSWVLDFGDGEGVPSLSADGGRVAFDSASEALTPDDPAAEAAEWDGFVRTFRPVLVADPIDFGPTGVGSTRTRTAALRVVGAGPLAIASIAVGGADFAPGADTCAGARLHREDSCLTSVRFTPTTAGGRSGAIVVRLADGREFAVDLRGSGSAEPVVPDGPELAATPDPVDFGPRLLLSTDPTATVTITNTGGSPMAFPAAPTATGDFSVRATDCGVLAPGASCAVAVQFRPTAPGARSGVLRVDAPGGPHLVGLSGLGSQPVLVVNPGVSKLGRVVSVSGTGFPAGASVTVGYRESVETASAQTSNEGAFTVSLLVFPKAAIGNRTVTAAVAGVAPEFIRPGRLLVVYPSMSPPEFLTRG